MGVVWVGGAGRPRCLWPDERAEMRGGVGGHSRVAALRLRRPPSFFWRAFSAPSRWRVMPVSSLRLCGKFSGPECIVGGRNGYRVEAPPPLLKSVFFVCRSACLDWFSLVIKGFIGGRVGL